MRHGKIQTVLGDINPSELGITLTHEHILMNFPYEFFKKRPIAIHDIPRLTQEKLNEIGDISLNNENEILPELLEYKNYGGKSIVDATNISLNRNPLGLKTLSEKTGLNIIMGAGYYLDPTHPKDMSNRTINEIKNEMVHDVEIGVKDTKIKSGIIGEIGISPISDERKNMTQNEEKVLRAAARAQIETGVPVSIHVGRSRQSPMEVIGILEDENADLSRIVLGHLCRTVDSLELLVEIAKKGCYLEYDMFGLEGYYRQFIPDFVVPNDQGRIQWLKKIIKAGFINKILVSQDIADKTYLIKYGGYGYGYILKYVRPWMNHQGITNDQIKTILVDNPKNMLTFK